MVVAVKPKHPTAPFGESQDEDLPSKVIVGEVWRPEPPPEGCDCMVCVAKRERLAELAAEGVVGSEES